LANATQRQKAAQGLISLIVLVGLVWFFFGGGLEHKAASDTQNIENQVASDAVKQYEIAERNGTKIDVCVQAGMVSAAYLQAKDENNYRNAKARENVDCAAAGMPSN
jgi:hypothetical protein